MSPITEPEWQSIRSLAERVVKSQTAPRDSYFITGKVLKVDALNKCIYMAEFGDQAIPVVSLDHNFKWYDDNHNGLASTADSAWHVIGAAGEPAFASGYSNWDGAQGVGRAPAFRKLTSGIVMCSGVIRTPAAATPNPAWTMPAGYLPNPSYDLAWVFSSNGSTCFGNVGTNGAISFSGYAAGAGWVYLNPIVYYAGPDPMLNVKTKTTAKTRTTTIVMPKVGQTVLVAREMGTNRLPRCLGVIQGTNWIAQGD